MFESKINRGKANGYAPLGSSGKVPLDYLPPIQSTLNTGSFATTGSNTFTGVQTLAGTSGTSWAELNIGQDVLFGNNTYDIRATGSSGAAMALTSDLQSFVGVIDGQFGPTGNFSAMINSKFGYPYSDGPVTLVGLQKSGSDARTWVYNYDGQSAFPGDITIGYSAIGNPTTSGSLNIATGSVNIKNGNINVSGSVYFGSGSSITETSSSIIITPAGAAAGQSLVVRQTAPINLYSDHPSGFYSGDTITLTFSPNGSQVTGTSPYVFTGCTQEQLGTSLSGSLIFNNEENKTLTWTIPSVSDISGFTFEIYNFIFESSQSISLSSSGSSEHSHIHLVSGDPSMVDIYLGDDDQYVKIEKNGGDVVIGTNLDTKHWRFDNSGSLTTPGDINVSGSLNVTGSVNIDNVIKLAPVTSLPNGQAGMLVASASYGKTNLYMYDGSDWKWLVTGSIV